MPTPYARWLKATQAGTDTTNPLHDKGFQEAMKVLEGSPTPEELLRAMKAIREATEVSCVENVVKASKAGIPYRDLAAASGIRQDAISVILHSFQNKKSHQKQEH